MTNDIVIFRQGAAAYRNSRNWAKEMRDEVIKQANDKFGAYVRDGFGLDGTHIDDSSITHVV